ncbi:DUF4097 family beta strand repeat-containing protein [Rhodococcoides yunnanense]|uniref:DUF4097 family beta strand repeat-containing protein n=1 Tax=Rhodococcoides yunnanense TaxID=278209 RepID=A0ABU4B9B7_9NOCA|nr:DUF4097 family beta strand repeat-containing protein [Rhodococcus yunnanensis]MDV6260779.1 DUF4097 family beta strand repeat-containing protein [Rhodococcus yunnanensis]
MNRIPLLRNVVAITTAAVVIGLAGAGTTAAIALGFSLPKTQDYDYSVDHVIEGSQLAVSTGFAHLTFVPSPDDSLHVRAHGIYRGDSPTIDIGADGSTVAVECSYDKYGSCDADVEIQIPADLTVTVDGANGDVMLSDVAADVDISTASGSVFARGSAGTLRIDTRFGDVKISDATATAVEVSTTFGEITVESRTAPKSVKTRNVIGDTTIGLPPADAYAVDAASEKGDVSVDVINDPRSPKTLSAHSEEGQITVRPR